MKSETYICKDCKVTFEGTHDRNAGAGPACPMCGSSATKPLNNKFFSFKRLFQPSTSTMCNPRGGFR